MAATLALAEQTLTTANRHGVRLFEGIVDPEVSRDAQEILQAGIISMAEGREVGLPLKSFLE